MLDHLQVEEQPRKSLPYLKTTTPYFQDLTDVLLVLTSGEKLPAHAAYLAAYSSVFSGILEAHSASRSSTASIPLPDCSLQEAEIFLCYLYRMRADAQLTPKSALAIVKLAHKFDVRVALEQCDEYLAQQAAINIRTNLLWVSLAQHLQSISRIAQC